MKTKAYPILLSVIVLMITTVPVLSQDSGIWSGFWKGEIVLPANRLPFELTMTFDDSDSLSGTLDIPLQNAYELELRDLTVTGDSVSFNIDTGGAPAFFSGKISGNRNEINGTFTQMGMNFDFFLERSDKVISGELAGLEHQEEIIIPVQNGQIGGTIAWHDSNYQKSSDLVILISGSGQLDRDETIAGFKPFRLLTSHLVQAGYSTFRYDDRGVGSSKGSEEDATLKELGNDLTAIINYWQNHNEYAVDDIFLLGHSQGAIVAYIAAKQTNVKGIISMAGPVVPADRVINSQIRHISNSRGIPDSVLTENLEFQNRIYEAVRTGSGWEEIEDDLRSRLEKQVESLPPQSMNSLGTPQEFVKNQITRQLGAAQTDWFRSFITTDPAELLNRLNRPLLFVFGEKDTQVFPEENITKIEKIRDSYPADIQVKTIPEANHLFQRADTGSPEEYAFLDRVFVDDFPEVIVEWLEKHDNQ